MDRPQLTAEATISPRFKPTSAFIIRTWAVSTKNATTQYRVQIEHIPTGTRKTLDDVNTLWRFIAGHTDLDAYENTGALTTHTVSE